MEIKQEDEEEQRKKRREQMALLAKAVILLRNRLGMNDILDGELSDFQDILNDDDDVSDNIEPLSTAALNDTQNSNQFDDLVMNGQPFDQLSGYMTFLTDV